MHVNPTAASLRAGEPSAPTPVDVRRFPWIKRLAADYAHNYGSLAPFFSGNPADRTAWIAALGRVQARARTHRPQELAAMIRAQQIRRGAPAAALAAGERLADGGTVAILTGQQAGLFGGPVFTLLKAITALKLADRVTRDHGVASVAVFWIDSEDHDWDEVRSCTVFDAELAPRTISLPPRGGPDHVPVAAVQLDENASIAIDELEQVLPATDFRGALVADLRAAYTRGMGMTEAFGRWVERVLGERGLIVYDASDPAAKPLVSELFSRELQTPGETTKLAAAAGADLTARGYHAQVQTPDDGVALFRLGAGRRPIQSRNGEFIVDGEHYPAATFVREAADRPAAFSPSVLLRPLVQDTIFPTICYVAGPNELAYLGQLRGIYERFGVPMPLMYSRASATLVDSAAARFLAKYRVSLESLQPQDDAALNALLKTQIPDEVDEALTSAVRALDEQMSRVVPALAALDPTLEGAARTTLTRMRHDLETLQGKTIQAAKRRNDTLRRQFTRTRALVFPNGHAQERSIGFVSFLNQYGPALVERLWDVLPVEMGQHWVITV